MYVYKDLTLWVEYTGQLLQLIGEDDFFHVPVGWSDQEKQERFGLIKIAMPEVPVGKRVVSYEIVDDANGNPQIEYVLEDAEPEPEPEINLPNISDRQFFQALALMDLITKQEALDAVKTGLLPSIIADFLSTLDEQEQFHVEMILSGATNFERNHPVTISFGEAFDWTVEEINQFWMFASSL